MRWGNKPTDGGHLILDQAEAETLGIEFPDLRAFIRPYISGGDFIDGTTRFCLWLVDAPLSVLRLPPVRERMARVRASRLASTAESTRAFADYPALFRQIAQSDSDYLAIPEVSSERRKYIPIAFVSKRVICSNKIQFVGDATRYHFGILTSLMHMAWMRYTCGRLKSDHSYSNTIVYNNFPWPENPTDAQKQKVEAPAQAVLAARVAHPKASLADLYDPLTMPPNLVKAHQVLDVAVDAAYGRKGFRNDAERVAFLFELYQKYTSLLPAAAPARTARRRTGPTTV